MYYVTKLILQQIESLGYAVSVHLIPSSLLGTVGAFVEMHAVKLSNHDDQHLARSADGDSDDDAYRTAWILAEMVGIELEDG